MDASAVDPVKKSKEKVLRSGTGMDVRPVGLPNNTGKQ